MTTAIAYGVDLDTYLTRSIITGLKAAGKVAAGVYTKNMQGAQGQAQVALCKELDFGLWLIQEGQGNLATMEQGAARGKIDGAAAAIVAQALGFPPPLPIFSGVDFAATEEQADTVLAYERGFWAGCGAYGMGLYADGAVLAETTSPTACYLPGAKGWPGYAAFLASGRVALLQGPTVELAGANVDLVEIHDLSVVWWQATVPAGATQGTATAVAAAALPDLKTLQLALIANGANIQADGVWGPRTAAALAKAYGT